MATKEKSRRGAGAIAPGDAAAGAAAEPAPTTYRVFADQAHGLQQAALDRRLNAGGGGRLDHSAILREVLDAVADGKPVAPEIRKALTDARERMGRRR
jgi:hypothetical protein